MSVSAKFLSRLSCPTVTVSTYCCARYGLNHDDHRLVYSRPLAAISSKYSLRRCLLTAVVSTH